MGGDFLFKEILSITVLSLFLAICSVALQGFEFGINNNNFHIPYVLKFYDMPAFLHDAFYQSLKNFTSVVWPLLSVFSTRENVAGVFVFSHIVSRWLALGLIITTAWHLGLQNLWKSVGVGIIFVVGVCFYGYSIIGKSGLFINYFTHTEMTYPFLLASMLLATAGRFRYAFLVNGLTFNVNAFVGVWGSFALMVCSMIWICESTEYSKGRRFNQIIQGIAISFLSALPTIVWIASTMGGNGINEPFDYPSYLRIIYPYHFFIDSATKGGILALSLCIFSGFIGLIIMRDLGFRKCRTWLGIYMSFIAIFIIGAAVPYVTGNRFILNLHLLRVDGVIQMLSLLFTGVAAIGFLNDSRKLSKNYAEALPVLCALAVGQWHVIALALMIFFIEAFESGRNPRMCAALLIASICLASLAIPPLEPLFWDVLPPAPIFAGVISIVCAVFKKSIRLAVLSAIIVGSGTGMENFSAGTLLLAATVWPTDQSNRLLNLVLAITTGVVLAAIVRSMDEAALIVFVVQIAFIAVVALSKNIEPLFQGWVNNLPISVMLLVLIAGPLAGSMFLRMTSLPDGNNVKEARAWVRTSTPDDSVFLTPLRAEGFQLETERKVWVDHKQGAAVMWAPSFFSQWHPRYVEVSRLKSLEDWKAYTCKNAIDYLVFAWPTGMNASNENLQMAEAVFSNSACAIFDRNTLCGN